MATVHSQTRIISRLDLPTNIRRVSHSCKPYRSVSLCCSHFISGPGIYFKRKCVSHSLMPPWIYRKDISAQISRRFEKKTPFVSPWPLRYVAGPLLLILLFIDTPTSTALAMRNVEFDVCDRALEVNHNDKELCNHLLHNEADMVAMSINDYNKIAGEHSNVSRKRGMFSKDAWNGMLMLNEYDKLVEEHQEEEKFCLQCLKNRRLLEHVWQTISNEYFDPNERFSQATWSQQLVKALASSGGVLRTTSQTYSAAKSMVATLGDKYSAFLNPAQYRLAIYKPKPSEARYLRYQYTGIGVELGPPSDSGGLTVVAPFAGSPAEEAGIVAGDLLLAVNGTPVADLTSDEAVTLLRGPVGSLVEIEVLKSSHGQEAVTMLLERRALPLPPVKVRFFDGPAGAQVEYIRLHYFNHQGTKDMMSAIRMGEALGVDGYVLDLRNNPGGVFEEAIAMAGLWLNCEDCDIAETVRSESADNGFGDVEDLVYVQGHLPMDIFGNHPGALTDAPLVLLTNRSSASASEVLVGALLDNKRATVVGERTYGKGVVQYYFPMDDGSGLKLTVAKYLTPARYDIARMGGIEPQITCHDHPTSGIFDDCIGKAMEEIEEAPLKEGGHNAGGDRKRLEEQWLPQVNKRWQALFGE